MKARVKWIEDRLFLGETGTGHSLVLGTTAAADGRKLAPSLMELMLVATGGCSAWDVVDILQKGRQAIDDCVVEVDGERAETEPKVFVRIHMHYVVKGRDLDPKKVKRAIQLSIDKYCSASAMMAKTAELTHDFEVVETGALAAE